MFEKVDNSSLLKLLFSRDKRVPLKVRFILIQFLAWLKNNSDRLLYTHCVTLLKNYVVMRDYSCLFPSFWFEKKTNFLSFTEDLPVCGPRRSGKCQCSSCCLFEKRDSVVGIRRYDATYFMRFSESLIDPGPCPEGDDLKAVLQKKVWYGKCTEFKNRTFEKENFWRKSRSCRCNQLEKKNEYQGVQLGIVNYDYFDYFYGVNSMKNKIKYNVISWERDKLAKKRLMCKRCLACDLNKAPKNRMNNMNDDPDEQYYLYDDSSVRRHGEPVRRCVNPDYVEPNPLVRYKMGQFYYSTPAVSGSMPVEFGRIPFILGDKVWIKVTLLGGQVFSHEFIDKYLDNYDCLKKNFRY
jgi:hypothetical protein